MSVDLAQISTRTDELAATFSVPALHVEHGKVPAWNPDGVLLRYRKRKPILVIGTVFDKLTPAEQDGTLASVVVLQHLLATGVYKFWAAFGLVVVALELVLGYFVGKHDMPTWQFALLVLVEFVVCFFVLQVVRLRRIVFRLDRRRAEVLGRPHMDMMLDRDSRQRSEFRGFIGAYLRLVTPREARRAKRLDATS
ncbi:hypothetical protein [Nocardia sp. NPDC050175]|uniref:hypothetical protein n=1 Tax=Nocardia sp. NPDC050175 TaxID=3364317 RepID=UPI00379351FB